MKKIELYDILTLNNGEKYTLASKIRKADKEYAMLIGVDEDENPISDKVKIVELINDNSKMREIIDKELSNKLSFELSKEIVNRLQ